mmetsp:Transcript_70535/g.168961  ORF Transcript_70535/g.168961 Transcript_70535/m.168961 type:complete len:242 (+) Transcript_70535:92-817(+)
MVRVALVCSRPCYPIAGHTMSAGSRARVPERSPAIARKSSLKLHTEVFAAGDGGSNMVSLGPSFAKRKPLRCPLRETCRYRADSMPHAPRFRRRAMTTSPPGWTSSDSCSWRSSAWRAMTSMNGSRALHGRHGRRLPVQSLSKKCAFRREECWTSWNTWRGAPHSRWRCTCLMGRCCEGFSVRSHPSVVAESDKSFSASRYSGCTWRKHCSFETHWRELSRRREQMTRIRGRPTFSRKPLQ